MAPRPAIEIAQEQVRFRFVRRQIDGAAQFDGRFAVAPFGQKGAAALQVKARDLDLVALSRVLMNPDEHMPPRLVDALYFINELATADGMDALAAAASAKGLVLEAGPTATPADVAVEVWLKSPQLLEEQHAVPAFGQAVGRGQPGQTAADDDHVVGVANAF